MSHRDDFGPAKKANNGDGMCESKRLVELLLVTHSVAETTLLRPVVVILAPDGECLSLDARPMMLQSGAAGFPWKSPTLNLG